jgi:hypothetical protein
MGCDGGVGMEARDALVGPGMGIEGLWGPDGATWKNAMLYHPRVTEDESPRALTDYVF